MHSGSRRPWTANIDMYRKIPTDLMEGTKRGSILSYLAFGSIVLLLVLETKDFMQTRLVTDLALDKNDDDRIRLNFNITMMDLHCDYAVVDAVSVLGDNQNITASVSKWQIDGEGVRRRFKGRNRYQRDIIQFDDSVTESLEELHANGEDAVSLDKETLEYAKRNQDYLFVDFYASWCSHCRDLAPTWEALAEVMDDAAANFVRKNAGDDYSEEDYKAAKQVELPVMIAKIDCVSHPEVCNKENIRAYPTLRLFVDGEVWSGGSEYKGHRTLQELVEWLHHVEELHQESLGKEDGKDKKLHAAHEAMRNRLSEEDASKAEREWNQKIARSKSRVRHEWKQEDHSGCQLSGHIMLDRAPGNFHIQARSKHHDLAAHATNVSHIIHSLYVGDTMGEAKKKEFKGLVPKDVQDKIAPFDGNAYVTQELHEAYHHYLKVISTNVDGLGKTVGGYRDFKVYQIVQNSQLAYYRNDVIPQAKFSFDLSPIAVSYRRTSTHWYDYLTSIMAVVGGVFTVVGMVESSISAAVSTARRTRF